MISMLFYKVGDWPKKARSTDGFLSNDLTSTSLDVCGIK